jgi:glycerol-3-phosphate dehydrogenase (NAD(P)+)
MRKKIGIIGAGAWGKALAKHLALQDHEVVLWDQSDHANAHAKTLFSKQSLITVAATLPQLCSQVSGVLCVIDSQYLPVLFKQLAPLMHEGQFLWLASKGLLLDDSGAMLFFQKLVEQTLPQVVRIALLSGPTFAAEVNEHRLTAAVAASTQQEYAQELADWFNSPSFQIELSMDLIGVQLCGALKNPLAVASGMAAALDYGANARAALLVRSLDEMVQLGQTVGAQMQTFYGLAGLGDLILTANSDLSRNYRLGQALGKGMAVEQACASIGEVVESVSNVRPILALAEKNQIVMPTVEQVHAVLCGHQSAVEALQAMFHAFQNKKPVTV